MSETREGLSKEMAEGPRSWPKLPPWYRSKLFWLGSVGFAFLLWLWWDSTRCETQIYLMSDEVLLVHARGELWLLWWDGFRDGQWNYFYTERHWPERDRPWSWEAFREAELYPDYGGTHKLSHPLILLTYVLAWAAALVGWQRWKRRFVRQRATSSRS